MVSAAESESVFDGVYTNNPLVIAIFFYCFIL